MPHARPSTGSVARRAIALSVWLCLPPAIRAQSPEAPDWRHDWALADGFTVRRDAEGFQFPTSIAFVPNPGPAPDDPLYFVTELEGTIKVVTNDRQVHVFARDVILKPTRYTLPSSSAEVGLAGICLEPTHGYVFATFAYRDSTGVLRNGIARLETRPGRFALTPSASVRFTRPFDNDVAAVSHQIGPCQATPTGLYVSVGDGEVPAKSADLHSTLGKILRLSLDGRPVPSNPFADSTGSQAAAYVWAFGLRNPFGLKIMGTRAFVADNGGDIDRFLEVEAGKNYGWEGSDLSIGMNAAIVFGPAVGPVQLDYCAAGTAGLPPAWSDRFFLALSGKPSTKLAADLRRKGVYVLRYGLAQRRMLTVPRFLIQYRGTDFQSVVGVACGPDAVYVVPLFPDVTGVTAVLAVKYDTTAAYPHRLATADAAQLIEDKGCYSCHRRGDKGGTVAPRLDRDSLVARLSQQLTLKAYRPVVARVDSIRAEPFLSERKARHDVMAAKGIDRIRLWMRHHIRQPKFDNPESQMPALGLSEADAEVLTDYLLTPSESAKAPAPKPKVRYRHLALAFVLGLALGGMGAGAVVRRRRAGRA